MTQSLNTSEDSIGVSEKKLGRLKDLLTPVLRRHLKSEKQAQALIEASAFVEQFDLLVKVLLGKLSNTFAITVDYSRSLSEMISVGGYNYANKNITEEHFRIICRYYKVDCEVELVHLNEEMTSDEVLEELDKLGLRPAFLEELLAFGETYPEIQRDFPIVSLGSSVRTAHRGNRLVPYIDGWHDRRSLDLYWFDFNWDAKCRFAAVRK